MNFREHECSRKNGPRDWGAAFAQNNDRARLLPYPPTLFDSELVALPVTLWIFLIYDLMSSDYDFDDDFDEAALAEVDAIEQAALQKASEPEPRHLQAKPLKADSSIDFSFDIDDSELQRLDDHVEQKYNEKVLQIPGPSSRPMNRTNSGNMLQRTLFGGVLQPPPSTSSKPSSSSTSLQRTHSTTRSLFGQQAPKTKTWDHTAFAQSGLGRKKSAKGKGKGKGRDDDDEDGDDFELPPPFVPSKQSTSICFPRM